MSFAERYLDAYMPTRRAGIPRNAKQFARRTNSRSILPTASVRTKIAVIYGLTIFSFSAKRTCVRFSWFLFPFLKRRVDDDDLGRTAEHGCPSKSIPPRCTDSIGQCRATLARPRVFRDEAESHYRPKVHVRPFTSPYASQDRLSSTDDSCHRPLSTRNRTERARHVSSDAANVQSRGPRTRRQMESIPQMGRKQPPRD